MFDGEGEKYCALIKWASGCEGVTGAHGHHIGLAKLQLLSGRLTRLPKGRSDLRPVLGPAYSDPLWPTEG